MTINITLGAGNDTVSVDEGPTVKINGGSSTAWNDHVIDGAGGFDTLNVDENSTRGDYFYVSMSHDGIVTLTAASGSASKSVSIVNFEKIQFWDITMNLGSAGNDAMTGTSFAESLYGFDGNDTIDGAGGIDRMFGGNGNDTYVLSAASEAVTELNGEGTDTIKASFTYSLVDTDGAGIKGGNVENLVLTGNNGIDGTGNARDNAITGNNAANSLAGGDGDDTLDGGGGGDDLAGNAGNDTYVVDDAADTVSEIKNEGSDTVNSTISYKLGANVENLTLLGKADIKATGNTAANTLVGNRGDNVLTGAKGQDTLSGKGGSDTFDFNSVKDSVVGTKHDLIKDFVHLTDDIDLSSIDADTTTSGNGSFSLLAAVNSVFTQTAGELRYLTAAGNTLIEGDTDGDGLADFQIEVKGLISFDTRDFIL